MKFIRNFIEWLIKSVQYSIFLWKDKDWDWVYILKILKYKLERTRKCIKKNDLIANQDVICQNIHIAEILLNRIIKDEYSSIQYDQLELKWGKISFENSRLTREKIQTDEDQIQYRKEFRKIIDHEFYMQNQDLEYLFKHLNKHLKTFWD